MTGFGPPSFGTHPGEGPMFFPQILSDQTFTVRGVSKNDAQVVLPFCLVTLFDTNTNLVVGVTESDLNGNYSFSVRGGLRHYAVSFGVKMVDAFTTDLETTQPFNLSFGDAGNECILSADQAHGGVQSLRMTSPAGPSQCANALKTFNPFISQIHALDFWFYFDSAFGAQRLLEISFEGWNGKERYYSGWNYSFDTVSGGGPYIGWRRWQYHPNFNLRWTYVPGGQGVVLSNDVWHHFYGEVDWTQQIYGKMIVDDVPFPRVPGLPMDVSANIQGSTSYQLSIFTWAQDTPATRMYIDDVVIGRAKQIAGLTENTLLAVP